MADLETRRWQARTLPIMAAMLLAAALFFGIVTVVKFDALSKAAPPPPGPVIAWTASGTAPTNFRQQIDLASAQAAYALEREVVDRRYDQVEAAFAARLWTRLMGFITGMLLALVGGAFVLGRLDIDASEVSAQAHGASLTLRSASPGIILAVLGTVLMLASIALPVSVATHDGAVYFPVAIAAGAAPPDADAISAADPAAAEPMPQLKSAGGK